MCFGILNLSCLSLRILWAPWAQDLCPRPDGRTLGVENPRQLTNSSATSFSKFCSKLNGIVTRNGLEGSHKQKLTWIGSAEMVNSHLIGSAEMLNLHLSRSAEMIV